MLGVITAITGREMCEFAVISECNLAAFITLSCWHTDNMPQICISTFTFNKQAGNYLRFMPLYGQMLQKGVLK